MDRQDQIDWSECPFVETKQGVQSGAPVSRGTRMPVSAIVDNFDYGVSAPKLPGRLNYRPIASRRLWLMPRAAALRILFDKNVPVGILSSKNGELLTAGQSGERGCLYAGRLSLHRNPRASEAPEKYRLNETV